MPVAVPVVEAPAPAPAVLETRIEIELPTRIIARQGSDSTDSSDAAVTSCPGGDGSGKCETGTGSSTFTLPIVLGVV